MKQPRPLIIIGAPRSGTKFLRDGLAAGGNVTAIPYDINYVWRYGNESWPDDVLPASQCSDIARQYIRKFVLGFGGGSDVIVEKTVANPLRVPFVSAVFPEAKFVHLVRDGRDVIESAYRQWQRPLDWRYTVKKARQFPIRNFRYAFWYAKNLLIGATNNRRGQVWGPRYSGISNDIRDKSLIEVCSKQWVACIERATNDLQALADTEVITVRYENLIDDESSWRDLCQFAGIEDIDAVLIEVQRSTIPCTVGKWTTGLDDERVNKMMPIVDSTLRDHRYTR